jgi:hypothetical protein
MILTTRGTKALTLLEEYKTTKCVRTLLSEPRDIVPGKHNKNNKRAVLDMVQRSLASGQIL